MKCLCEGNSDGEFGSCCAAHSNGVSITFDDEFVVHDIKIIEGQNGLFIAMPSRKMGEGDFRDIAHPLVSETRNKIRDAIFEEYDKVLAQKSTEADEEPAEV